MEPTYLFLDCEWADLLGTRLVSLALISADGEHRFYAQRDPLPTQPTNFVRTVVYPLLDRGTAALPDAEFTCELKQFFFSVPWPSVIFDYPNDGSLLRHALAGFDLSSTEAAACGPIPSPLEAMLMEQGDLNLLLEDWFQTNPAAAARRHHAMVDANAPRHAWLRAQPTIRLKPRKPQVIPPLLVVAKSGAMRQAPIFAWG